MSDIDWQSLLGPLAQAEYGLDANGIRELESSTFAHSPRAVRVRPGVSPDDLPFATTAVPWFERGRFVSDNAVRPASFLEYSVGDYYTQDAGSMLALELCDVQPGETVIDCCASPGGKSTGIAEVLGPSGVLIANEVIASRLELLRLALEKSGDGNHAVSNSDIAQLSERIGPSFDCVLVDAPCSGQSMVVRGKQSMAAFSMAQVEHSAARQQRILQAASTLVGPGGRLVYSTCTFAYAENEAVIERFLAQNTDWACARFDRLSQWESEILPGSYRLWPHRDRCAGAFATALHRVEPPALENRGLGHIGREDEDLEPTHRSSPRPARQHTSKRSSWRQEGAMPEALDWLGIPSGLPLFESRSELHLFPDSMPTDWIDVCCSSGVRIAKEKSGRWEPLFGSSTLSLPHRQRSNDLELSTEQAKTFVAGEAVRINASLSGWLTATWYGKPIGWGKLSNGTLKNHIPKMLRHVIS